ncbi:MAG: right-handed parallel beta-helix repeat-containing protein [Caldilineaceae bacterium]|nr:right-handed parallel beta-helix repeat-containing protein [Caldilineaceae bacterium]
MKMQPWNSLVRLVFPLLFVFMEACSAAPLATAADAAHPSTNLPGQTDEPFVEIWVDPSHGDDNAGGATRGTALRTITAAWQRVPVGAALSDAGYRILLAAGDYAEGDYPVYWEDRHGTAANPILIEAADGARSARLAGFLNFFDVDHVVLRGVAVANQGDVFHCEQCRHFAIDDVAMDGDRQAHETIKINQSQYITIENSDIQGSYENAIDFVAVQYATIRNNRIHAADDWCAYVKGGSAYVVVEANEIYDCGTGGFTAGQGTGFEYMTAPWLHYEAYDVRVVNNIIHDTYGAGLGVNGGYNILFAYNTLYRVGARSHLIEVVHGGRSCDGDSAGCQTRHAQGGWGPTQAGDTAPIPNRNVFIYNNLFVNPAGYQSQWQHFTVHGPLDPPAGLHVPSPAHTDDNLRIAGNVIWNGPADHALGVGEDGGCLTANPTCNAAQLLADNAINTVEPHLVDPAAGNFRVANGAELPAPLPQPDFPAWDALLPPVPQGALNTVVTVDYAGNTRVGADRVGAFGSGEATPSPTPDLTDRVFLPQVVNGAPGQ